MVSKTLYIKEKLPFTIVNAITQTTKDDQIFKLIINEIIVIVLYILFKYIITNIFILLKKHFQII